MDFDSLTARRLFKHFSSKHKPCKFVRQQISVLQASKCCRSNRPFLSRSNIALSCSRASPTPNWQLTGLDGQAWKKTSQNNDGEQ